MALTSGAKKIGITVLIAAAIAGGGYYASIHKKDPIAGAPGPSTTTTTTTTTVPVVVNEQTSKTPSEYNAEGVDKQARESDKRAGFAPVKKHHVAKATVKKESHGTASHQGGHSKVDAVRFDGDSDAIKALAGKSSL